MGIGELFEFEKTGRFDPEQGRRDMKEEAKQQIRDLGVDPDKITSSHDLMHKLADKDARLHELCKCLTKTPDWKYHETYCPVWKNGRIGELEAGWKRLVNDSLEAVHDLSGNNEVLKARVVELEGVVQKLVDKCEHHGINYRIAVSRCPDLKLNESIDEFKQLLENKAT